MVNDAEYHDSANTCLPSTTFGWKRVKISAHPQGTGQRGAAAPPRASRKQRRAFRRLQIVVEYRGGPQCSYTVTADGKTWRYEGGLCFHDVMTHFWERVH